MFTRSQTKKMAKQNFQSTFNLALTIDDQDDGAYSSKNNKPNDTDDEVYLPTKNAKKTKKSEKKSSEPCSIVQTLIKNFPVRRAAKIALQELSDVSIDDASTQKPSKMDSASMTDVSLTDSATQTDSLPMNFESEEQEAATTPKTTWMNSTKRILFILLVSLVCSIILIGSLGGLYVLSPMIASYFTNNSLNIEEPTTTITTVTTITKN